METSLVARVNAHVAAHNVIAKDAPLLVDVSELLRHPVVAAAGIGIIVARSHLTNTPGDTILPLYALHQASLPWEVEPVGADGPHFLHGCSNQDVNGTVAVTITTTQNFCHGSQLPPTHKITTRRCMRQLINPSVWVAARCYIQVGHRLMMFPSLIRVWSVDYW